MSRFTTLILFTLLYSLASFASDETNYIQEQLKKQLEEIVEKNVENFNKLQDDREDIIGIEVMIAAAGPQLESGWGHALLRFVNHNEPASENIVIGFVAQTNDPNFSKLKGIFGGYQMGIQLMKLSEAWEKYLRYESRPFERHIIPTNKKIRDELITNLKEWKDDPSRAGNYAFLTNNCSLGLFRFLSEVEELSRLHPYFDISNTKEKKLKGWVKSNGTTIPTNLGPFLQENFLSPYPTFMVSGLRELFKKLQSVLNLEKYEQVFTGDKWPVKADELIKTNFSLIEVKRLRQELDYMPTAVRKSLNKDKTKVSADRLMGIIKVPHSFYELCATRSCILLVNLQGSELLQGDWSKHKELMKPVMENMKHVYRTGGKVGTTYTVTAPNIEPFKIHYELLFKTGESK